MRFIPEKKATRFALATLMVLAGAGGAIMIPACAGVGATPSKETIKGYKSSPNHNGKEFVNGIPAAEPKLLKTLGEWMKGGNHTEPENPVPVENRTKADFESLPASGLRITWVGHSTTMVEIDGARFLLDPIWSKRSSPFSWTGPKRFHDAPVNMEDLPPIDGVLISHDHYDHLDRDTVVALAEKGYRFVVPLGVGARLRGWDIPAQQIDELDWWQNTRISGTTITATPSRHFSGRSLVMADRNETLWAGFAIKGEAHNVYYTGDTGMFPGFRDIGAKLGPFDATLVEVGAYNQLWADLHLGPEQAVQAVKDARGGLMIPVHWATFDLALHSWVEPAERVIVAALKQKVEVAIPKPGQSVEPSNPPALTRWWPELPWQTEEEHPVVASGLEASGLAATP